jgi:hypothetical protein
MAGTQSCGLSTHKLRASEMIMTAFLTDKTTTELLRTSACRCRCHVFWGVAQIGSGAEGLEDRAPKDLGLDPRRAEMARDRGLSNS